MPKRANISKPPLDYGAESIGQRLARLRKERGFTQVELAEHLGTGQSLITAYETDRRALSAEMVVRFAMALDVSTDELLQPKAAKKTLKKPSLKIVRRMERIESLPRRKQDALLTTIDAFLSTPSQRHP
jgi:transcriptional regulator with XRE-family HTH domain